MRGNTGDVARGMIAPVEHLLLVLAEDEHLLVINKPAGWNTHAPAPFAGEGVYEWLRHREPRWASLAIIHRLDKETSGVLVFAKTPVANRSLTQQFTARAVSKSYRLVTDRPVSRDEFRVASTLVRAGDRYVSRPQAAGGEYAETLFRVVERHEGRTVLAALPATGRTHQIRVHAAESGCPILGDTLYGGTPAARVWLHAESIAFIHPEPRRSGVSAERRHFGSGKMAALCRDAATVQDGDAITFRAPVDFAAEPRLALRRAILDPALTDCFRAVHGAADGWPGWQVETLGPFLLSQAEAPLSERQRAALSDLVTSLRSSGSPVRGVYHKRLSRHVRQTKPEETSPVMELGEPAPDRFAIRENGLSFELSFCEGYSVGLFLDQRDNRRRLLTRHVAADFSLECPSVARPEVLNTFAYTGGFSVCAALGGARVTSLDLSRKYLDWARRNFTLNGQDPAEHDFIYGDVFDWLRRLAKKQRRFDVVLLDPPTFSQTKEHGVFRAEKDYGALVTAALPLLAPEGVLFASTNAAGLAPEKFLAQIDEAVRAAGRRVVHRHYVPQPPDFPITRDEPAYLKTVWLRVA